MDWTAVQLKAKSFLSEVKINNPIYTYTHLYIYIYIHIYIHTYIYIYMSLTNLMGIQNSIRKLYKTSLLSES